MKLTDLQLRGPVKLGKLFDGRGLYLNNTAAGGRYWRLKYRFGGKEELLALGTCPAVSMKQARKLAGKARELLSQGTGPGAARKADRLRTVRDQRNTLRAVSLEWWKHQADRWADSTRHNIQRSLELHIFPTLGGLPTAEIHAGLLKAAVQAVEKPGATDMVSLVLQRVK